MTTLMKYTINDIENIATKYEKFILHEDQLKIIENLIKELNIDNIPNEIPLKRNDRSFEKGYKRSRSKKSMNKIPSASDMDEWEMLKSFKPQQKEEVAKIDKDINEIRSDLNKISKSNLNILKVPVIEKIFTIFNENAQENDIDDIYSDNQKRIGNVIFDIMSSNQFLSEIYAEVYVDLVGKSEYFGNILDDFIVTYKTSLENIKYIGPDENYEAFCNYNQKNELRKSNSLFLVHLMKYNMISKELIIDLILELQDLSFQYIDLQDKLHEIEEFTENLFVMIQNGKELLENHIKWNSIQDNISKFSKLKARDHISLSTRCVFKYMDM